MTHIQRYKQAVAWVALNSKLRAEQSRQP